MIGLTGLNVEVTEAINCAEGVAKFNNNFLDCTLLDGQMKMGSIY